MKHRVRSARVTTPIVCAALLAALFVNAAVLAQAAQGHGIPDPITSAELQRYGDRLVLSDEQRQALQPLHEEYRERFRELRETEIDRYLEDMQQQGQSTSPGSEAWRRLENRRNSILSRIRAIDESFFGELEPILIEAQQERLPRVRLARQRARLMPMAQMALSMTQIVDLSELALEVETSVTEREAIDPFLAQYEHRLTRMMQQLPPIIASVRQQIEQSAEEFRREVRENPAMQPAASRRMMQQHHEAQLATQEHLIEMRVLGRRTLYDMLPHLSDRAARELRARFMTRAYHFTIWQNMRSPVEGALDTLLTRDDLDTSQQKLISDLAFQMRQPMERIVREVLEAADKRDATTTTFSIMNDMDSEREFERWVREQRERVEAIENSVIAELSDGLPPDAVATLIQSLPPARRAAAAAQAGAAAPVSERPARPPQITHGGLVTAMIADRDIAEYAHLLDLDDEQREFLRQLHKQYMTRLAETAVPASREAVGFYSPEHGDPKAFVERLAASRSKAIAEIEAADRALFDALAGEFPGKADPVERVRLLRERQRYTLDPMAQMRILSSRRVGLDNPASIDLSRLARRLRIDIAATPEADEVVHRYERQLAALLRQSYKQTLHLSDVSTIGLGYFQLSRQRDEEPAELREARAAYREAEQEASRALVAIERAIVQLNRQAINELLDLLPEDDGNALLAEYRDRAMPRVYRDPGAMEPVLQKTLQMDDLNLSQRERLAELLAEYRSAYQDLTEQMRELAEEQEQEREARERGESSRPASARLHEQFEKLRHERQELSARTIVALRGILDDSQLARLGPMPDPTGRPRPRWIEDRVR